MTAPVDLARVRQERALDRLADLAREVDVWGLLEREEEAEVAKQRMTEPLTLRVRVATREEADRLVEALADTPEARGAGGQWSRATVLRLAIDAGLEVLAKRAGRSRAGTGGAP